MTLASWWIDSRGRERDAEHVPDVSEDETWLRAWQAGDKAAGERLFDRHYGAVTRFFGNKTSAAGGDTIEDLIQRTFLRCLESVARLKDYSRFRAFLFGIARHVLLDHFRARTRDQMIDFETISAADLSPGLSTLQVRAQEDRRLLEALRTLPVDLQTVLELYYWEDMTASEIGEVLERPEGTVRTRIRRARTLLQKHLAAHVPSSEREPSAEDLDARARRLAQRVSTLCGR